MRKSVIWAIIIGVVICCVGGSMPTMMYAALMIWIFRRKKKVDPAAEEQAPLAKEQARLADEEKARLIAIAREKQAEEDRLRLIECEKKLMQHSANIFDATFPDLRQKANDDPNDLALAQMVIRAYFLYITADVINTDDRFYIPTRVWTLSPHKAEYEQLEREIDMGVLRREQREHGAYSYMTRMEENDPSQQEGVRERKAMMERNMALVREDYEKTVRELLAGRY